MGPDDSDDAPLRPPKFLSMILYGAIIIFVVGALVIFILHNPGGIPG
jgi:hypothetical protein